MLTSARVAIGLGGLLTLLIVETCCPFRRPVDSRWRRYVVNFFIIGSNALVLSVLLGGLLVASYQALELHRVGVLHWLGVSGWWNVAVSLVALDGVTYGWHRAYHAVPAMWRLHRVHHSDLDLDVTSAGRFHLLEMGLSALFRLLVIALLGAGYASVVLFEIIFGVFNQLEHANLQLPRWLEGRLRLVIVTPDMHRVHHSQVKAETNSNFGTIFSFWDRWFASYRQREDQRALAIGLPEYATLDAVTLIKVLLMPWGPPCESPRAPEMAPA